MNSGQEAIAAELEAQAAIEDGEAAVLRGMLDKLPAGSPNHAQALGGLEAAVCSARRLRQRADELRSEESDESEST